MLARLLLVLLLAGLALPATAAMPLGARPLRPLIAGVPLTPEPPPPRLA